MPAPFPPPKDLARFLERLANVPMVVRYRMAAGMALAGEHADFVAGIEYLLQAIVRRRCQVTLVSVVPEVQAALISYQLSRLS